MPTPRPGTFYISNQGGNDIIRVSVTGLNTNDLYADIASKNELVQIDPTTGKITPIVTGLSSPHGLAFVPSVSDTGKPKLADPSQFSGTVAGLATGNHLTVGDSDHAAKVGLLANYMASSFASPSGGQGSSFIADAPLSHQALLASPHAT